MKKNMKLGCFFPCVESRAKLYKATEGMGGQMEKGGICVFNRWKEERGGSGGKVRRGSGSWGSG